MAIYREFAAVARVELLGELAVAGFPPTVAGDLPRLRIDRAAGTVLVAVAEGEDADAIAAVVAAHDAAAHDAAAHDAAAEQEQAADEDDRLTLRQVVAVLLADAERLEDTAQAMSAQVLRNHLARADKALAATLRYLRRRGL